MKTTLSIIMTLFLDAEINSIGQLSTITATAASVAIAAVLGLAVLLCGLRNAPEGYEDEEGFHFKPVRPRVKQPSGLALFGARNAA